ncbi:MAG: peptide transporter [Elusimicrobiota bacterium]
MRRDNQRDINEYRDLIEQPKEFKDGFNLKTVIGAIFIGFIMMPGSIYLGLVAGQGVGPAAQWVTIILFMEVMRRSFQVMTKQELFVLYYVAGHVIAGYALHLSGGPWSGLIWHQFFVSSPAAAPFADQIPIWVSPQPMSDAIINRSFLHPEWLPAIGLLLINYLIGRVNAFTFGYVLFRITSDVEKLPFPMAPIAAQGATALAESSSKSETWRWRMFSIGSVIGLLFGLVYIGIPTISSMILVTPVTLLPIPWIDLTAAIETILPATPFGFVTSLGTFLIGFVLPYWIVVGGFASSVITMIANPILQKTGVLKTWRPGMDTFHTSFANSIDFWLSFGIGIAFAVFIFSIYEIVRATRKKKTESGSADFSKLFHPPEGRGDFSVTLAMGLFVLSSILNIVLCRVLVPHFPIIFFIGFALLYTPMMSYVHARLTGMTGQYAGIPMVREATFLLSGYKGAAIWFAPLPMHDYGGMAGFFREVELTGTKITSVIKAELLVMPIIFICGFIFWSFIWQLGPIPSALFPYAQKTWYFHAMQSSLWISSTAVGGKPFLLEALKFPVMATGLGFGLLLYVILAAAGLPMMLIYGFIRGVGQLPHSLFLEFIGALLGRYYFAKKFGEKNWRNYAPVIFAGFSCGMGLIGMVCIAATLIAQSVSKLPF